MPGKRPWDPEDKEQAALHEAGHAVVAWSLRVPIERVRLDLENESGGVDYDPDVRAVIAGLHPVKQIALALAGYVSERAFKPPRNRFVARCRAFDDLHSKVPPILREHYGAEGTPQARAACKQGGACAKKRLREHKAKVWRIARHLVEHGYMDRLTFEAIMAEARMRRNS